MAILASNSYSITNVNDGQITYPHYAFSDNADGTGLTTTDNGQRYQGYYSDYTQADSTDKTKYKWADRWAKIQVGGRNLIIRSQIQNGYIDNAGNLVNTNDHFTTGFVDATNNKQFTITAPKNGGGFLALFRLIKYDAGKNFLGRDVVSYTQDTKTVKVINLADNVAYFKVSFDGVYGEPYKIERGNVASDYTLATEDIQAQIDSKADSALTQEQLLALTDQTNRIQANMEALAAAKALTDLEEAYKEYVRANDAAKKVSEGELATLKERTAEHVTKLAAFAEDWEFMTTKLRIAEEGIYFGKLDGSSEIKITDDRISFWSSKKEVMWITAGTLNIDNGIFTVSVQIGRFREEQYTTNPDINVIRYVG